jgi:hypothetical protein
MKKVFFLVVIMFFMSWTQAFADYTFSYISNDGSIGTTGTLITATNGPGPLTVTGGSMTGSFGTVNLLLADPTLTYTTSPSGQFWYDNQLSPGSLPMLTQYGLLFAGTLAGTGYTEINLWGNTAALNDYTYMTWTTAAGTWSSDLRGTFTVAPVPIPGALLLFAPGLAGLAILRKRLKK